MADDAMRAMTRWVPTEQEREKFFPDVDPGIKPTGSRVLVQLKQPGKLIGNGFLYKSQQQIDRERANTQVALVRDMGALAFHNRSTLQPWPEGQWCRPGDIVIVPIFGKCEGWEIRIPDAEDPVEFRLYDDVAILGHLMRNPADIWG